MTNPCACCDKPQTDAAALCHLCTAEAVRLLRGTRALADELGVNVAKLDRTMTVPASRPFGHPIPLSLPAAEVLWRLAATIVTWERAVRLLPDLPKAMPAWKTPDRNDSAAWLAAAMPTVRRHAFAGQLVADLRRAWADALRIIDLPAQTVFLGPCEASSFLDQCHAAVYAQIGASTAVCSSCGAQHDVAERREWLLTSLEELAVTASMARRLAVYLGVSMPESTISRWKTKGVVVPLSDTGVEVVFRFGDLLAQKRKVIAQRASVEDDLPATA